MHYESTRRETKSMKEEGNAWVILIAIVLAPSSFGSFLSPNTECSEESKRSQTSWICFGIV